MLPAGFTTYTDQPAAELATRLKLLVGIDAGAPAGEPLTWQLMGGAPAHAGTRLADSLAKVRGWTTTATAPRPISDVYAFSQHGVPILFPIPGKPWRGFDEARLAETVKIFDHYHQPADQWRPDFPMTGTWYYADWVYAIGAPGLESGGRFLKAKDVQHHGLTVFAFFDKTAADEALKVNFDNLRLRETDYTGYSWVAAFSIDPDSPDNALRWTQQPAADEPTILGLEWRGPYLQADNRQLKEALG